MDTDHHAHGDSAVPPQRWRGGRSTKESRGPWGAESPLSSPHTWVLEFCLQSCEMMLGVGTATQFVGFGWGEPGQNKEALSGADKLSCGERRMRSMNVLEKGSRGNSVCQGEHSVNL